ncbi:MFS transporter [Erythrobacter arachoides]|uniref:MFS transporter n=1 Tax=Aurantiacibacter arachoides TaxID=1850444 RepID=A0A845A4U2_9SPHN|nr:MFS transporter [Aurantiacibacter arachoides]MXO92599.1 MFS transporter [Aurantiacibacter arachoides]GGD55898.1 MFS transporter [Aurantiacibacter arachoides]
MGRQPTFMTGIALLLPITLTTMAIVLLAPVMPLLMAEFAGVSNHEYWVPMVLTLPALCVAFLCPVAGILGDYFGKRKLLLASFLIYAVVGVAPVFLTELTHILVSRVGVGVAEALIYVLSTTMIADFFHGEARDKWLAAQPAFASMSALVFFNLGGVLGEFGWRTPFWVYGSALVMFVLVWLFTWEPEKVRGDHAIGEVPHVGPPGTAEGSRSLSWEGFPWARMGLIVLITVYGSVFFYTVQIQSSSGLAQLGMTSPAAAGFWTSVASVGVPLGTVIYGLYGSRNGVARLLLIEFALLAVGFFTMGTAAGTTQFLVGCFVNQLGAGLLLPTLLVWGMSILPFEVRSRGAGFWQSAFALGQWLSPLVVTFFALRLGGLLSSFQALSYFAAAGVLVALIARRFRARPAHG